MAKKLYKTTIVIWTDHNPQNVEINDLAQNAVDGDAYCSKKETAFIEDAESDIDWDGTEFFDSAKSPV